ncbi:MAG TPA: tRNA (adenosine(37)-N6)-threonylcarbamoyltransferase complex dimerization subunit type 1 TsaB [Thermoanaerobaculia bacterium]|nr:tRNA (adenosine(37)-N6)-threonylcarbamoyltransferase complex dimerization subunit type 1 TsaB [Thermoanaerobaculia bacterium]
MLILGVDSSLPLLSVALLGDDELIATVALQGKGSRNEKLLPAIDWLLSENALDRRAIDLFAVTRGPGSFTGVRVGLATVQGMALALGRGVCAMSTHEAIAAGGAWAGAKAAVVDDAGRGEFYVSLFDSGRAVIAPRLATAAERDAIVRDAGVVITVADHLRHANVAAECARRAKAIAGSGALAEYGDITPVYVRLAEAEVKLGR